MGIEKKTRHSILNRIIFLQGKLQELRNNIVLP